MTKHDAGARRMQALGRLKQGQMNKTERAYADHLFQLQAVGGSFGTSSRE